jgi:hypothetical protein
LLLLLLESLLLSAVCLSTSSLSFSDSLRLRVRGDKSVLDCAWKDASSEARGGLRVEPEPSELVKGGEGRPC